jgi:hypothetical protein
LGVVCALSVSGTSVADIIVGTGPGSGHVKVFGGSTLSLTRSFLPYGGFTGGVRVAAGDVNGDGVADIITGTETTSTHVKVFDGNTGAELRSFFGYAGFSGGVRVAAGDIDGDGHADVITGAGAGSAGGHVKVFSGATGSEIRSFLAYGSGLNSGVTVAAGDVDRDGFDDIITGTGAGAPGGHVKVFSGATGAELRSFFAYPTLFQGSINVGGADLDGDGAADIFTGTAESTSHVKAFDGLTSLEVRSFLPYGAFSGGVSVAAGDLNGDGRADIVTGAGAGSAGGHVRVFDGMTGDELHSLLGFDGNFTGGVYVAAISIPAPGASSLALMLMAWARGRRRR